MMEDTLNVGDAFEVGPFLGGLCDEQMILTVEPSKGTRVDGVDMKATFFGVFLCNVHCGVDGSWEVK